jgi:VanZ family protein
MTGARRGTATRVAAWAAFLAWAALVWFLSSRSDPKSDLHFPWDLPDKVSHGIEFAAGGFLAREALAPGRSPFLAAILACALWGFADEVHQGFVPGRTTDPWDLAADVTGAALGACLHFVARDTAARSARSQVPGGR